jgi:hypothetical protein
MSRRHLPWFFALSLVTTLPAIAAADASQWGRPSQFQPAYQEGYERGARAGAEDARRGDRFNFTDEGAYRSADAGYRSQYGNRNLYREEFRRAFESGYRTGYAGYGRGGYGRGNNGQVLPPWSGNRGGRGTGRFDPAVTQGYNDGYEAGLDDGRDGRRFDPVGEGRYRSGDRGYDRDYGSRDYYRTNYRVGFRNGYEEGFRDGTQYRRR